MHYINLEIHGKYLDMQVNGSDFCFQSWWNKIDKICPFNLPTKPDKTWNNNFKTLGNSDPWEKVNERDKPMIYPAYTF